MGVVKVEKRQKGETAKVFSVNIENAPSELADEWKHIKTSLVAIAALNADEKKARMVVVGNGSSLDMSMLARTLRDCLINIVHSVQENGSPADFMRLLEMLADDRVFGGDC